MHFPVTEGIVVHCKIGEVKAVDGPTSAQTQLDRTDQAPMFRMDNPPLRRSRGLPDNSHRGAFYCREEGDQAGIEPGPGRTRSAEIEVRAVLHSEADAQN